MSKTYCISDIHGHIDNLNRFIETLDKNDVVYVLGDVIDKGPSSLECLLKIMNDSRFHMLLGNHEYMMFNLLSSKCSSYIYHVSYENWVVWNEGGDTLDEFNKLPKDRQIKVFNYIRNLPLNIPNLKVNNRTFCLVHSNPHSYNKETMSSLDYDELKIHSYVWERITPLDKLDVEDQIVIAGHTPVQFYLGSDTKEVRPIFNSNDIKNANYIDIDGGLATRGIHSKLIALCLDDLTYKIY